jgi:hypothetical protein
MNKIQETYDSYTKLFMANYGWRNYIADAVGFKLLPLNGKMRFFSVLIKVYYDDSYCKPFAYYKEEITTLVSNPNYLKMIKENFPEIFYI